MGHPLLLFCLFWLFLNKHYNFTNIRMWQNVDPGVQTSWPLERESPPITTKSGQSYKHPRIVCSVFSVLVARKLPIWSSRIVNMFIRLATSLVIKATRDWWCTSCITSGLTYIITVSVMVFHVVITLWYPQKYKNQNYYLIKDFINCYFLFVNVPLATILKNEKMLKYVKSRIKNNEVLIFARNILLKMFRFSTSAPERSNKIFVIYVYLLAWPGSDVINIFCFSVVMLCRNKAI